MRITFRMAQVAGPAKLKRVDQLRPGQFGLGATGLYYMYDARMDQINVFNETNGHVFTGPTAMYAHMRVLPCPLGSSVVIGV